MGIRNPRRKKPQDCRMEMAVRAVESNYSASDLPMAGIDLSPTALGLPQNTAQEMRPNRRCTHHAEDGCIVCGQSF